MSLEFRRILSAKMCKSLGVLQKNVYFKAAEAASSGRIITPDATLKKVHHGFVLILDAIFDSLLKQVMCW